ncbi:MAG TPA: hypothetical protein VJB82_00310 [Candidatus Peribacterales bacterium]|nr:hypothetical protein [Candidatus Peribacterales bacterium]
MKRACITVFFCIHAVAIGIGSIPSEGEVLAGFGPIAHMYLNATGQWQKWNLFAPDPLRTFSSYSVEIVSPSQQKRSIPITAESLPWYERTNILKIMRQVSNTNEEQMYLRAALLHSLCRRFKLPSGSTLTLVTTIVDVLDPDHPPSTNDDVSVSCNQA